MCKMSCSELFFFIFIAWHLYFGTSEAGRIQYTIIVDQSGQGNFTQVQQAIDSIPSGNKQWIRVKLMPGTYNEKVNIPGDKPYILLKGEINATTIIQYGDYGSSIGSSTFSLLADNFAAKHITFKNTFKASSLAKLTWAPAALIQGDRASFVACAFVGLQDTLADSVGRHYFKGCHVEGSVDFIWGFGQSVYKGCTIYVNGDPLGGVPGYITAQGRENGRDPSGFVFKNCIVGGSGLTYLGRAYRAYSRVLFYQSTLFRNVVPQGWDPRIYGSQEENIRFGEVECKGPGARKARRAQWLRQFTSAEVRFLTNTAEFMDKEGWIEQHLSLS